MKDLADWVASTLTSHFDLDIAMYTLWEKGILTIPVDSPSVSHSQPLEALFADLSASDAAFESWEGKKLVLACLTDGMSPAGKEEYRRLHTWCRSREIAVQVINGKNGEHNFFTKKRSLVDVQTNLIQSIFMKLNLEPKQRHKKTTPTSHEATPPTSPPLSPEQTPEPSPALSPLDLEAEVVPESQASGSTPEAMQVDPEREWLLSEQPATYYSSLCGLVRHRLLEGNGECMCKVGVDCRGRPKGLNEAEYTESLDTIRRIATDLHASTSMVIEKTVKESPLLKCGEWLVRRWAEEDYIDMRIAICGNVDSGKSTFVGVLTKGILDNGRGSVRQKVFKHKHEQESGRTSAISEQLIGFDSTGNVVNYADLQAAECLQTRHLLSAKQISEKSSKIITFYDLAGHEKYLKTTVLGMTGSMPDYACIVISANNGIQRMTKEHLGLCLALKIPFFVVITRIDMCPDVVTANTTENIVKLLKQPGVNKLPFLMRGPEDVVICAKNIKDDRIAPIFHASNVTGQNLDTIKRLLNLLPFRRDWKSLAKLSTEMIIDSTFYVTGVGTVVGGIVTQGVISLNDVLTLGPNSNGHFRQTLVKGIHVKQCPVNRVEAGSSACIALKKERRSDIRKGMVLLDSKAKPQAAWEFEAEVVILYHSTTIASNYQPVVHCGTVRQSCAITLTDRDVLRTGDKAHVRFRFIYKPEYVKLGSKIIFREGRTKGLGSISQVFPMK
eukprot:NODE_386_length_2310_cov_65.706367_g357_i0.p1 GENE.NODE_386_length_2310_cov_65.706367_g357_i0~~NODE_386_length_2310_cov_65.706367_g357_i0.p1  ORF type:complete len:751 (+),score=187.55 NODE_386_length_2310_cov_65.706367_g357_i0:76-2253(+)